jgi:hypothetical protein
MSLFLFHFMPFFILSLLFLCLRLHLLFLLVFYFMHPHFFPSFLNPFLISHAFFISFSSASLLALFCHLLSPVFPSPSPSTVIFMNIPISTALERLEGTMGRACICHQLQVCWTDDVLVRIYNISYRQMYHLSLKIPV